MFMLVGSFGGIIGGLFCSANRALALLRRRLSFNIVQKGIEVFVIAAVTATLIWVLPSFFSRCGDIEPRRLGHTYYKQFTCEEGEYNELATLLLNPLGAKGITLLFTEDDPDAFSMSTCIIAGMTHLVILCVAFGMSISAGIFIPLLFIGTIQSLAWLSFFNLWAHF
jgi:H+/Cl- antiporter ClcA